MRMWTICIASEVETIVACLPSDNDGWPRFDVVAFNVFWFVEGNNYNLYNSVSKVIRGNYSLVYLVVMIGGVGLMFL